MVVIAGDDVMMANGGDDSVGDEGDGDDGDSDNDDDNGAIWWKRMSCNVQGKKS